jgi:hypothetical protein
MLPSDLLKVCAYVRHPRYRKSPWQLPARFTRLPGTIAIIFCRESAGLGVAASPSARATATGTVAITVAVKTSAASASRSSCSAAWSTASTRRRLGPSFINFQITTAHFLPVKPCNRFGSLRVIWHFDECEPAGAPSFSIHGNVNTRDLAERFKHSAQFRLSRLKAHIPYKQVLHVLLSFNL